MPMRFGNKERIIKMYMIGVKSGFRNTFRDMGFSITFHVRILAPISPPWIEGLDCHCSLPFKKDKELPYCF